MIQRKIKGHALSEREPVYARVSRRPLTEIVYGLKRFVKECLVGIMELDLKANVFGDVNICTYFFSYSLRLIVANSDPEKLIHLEMTNTDQELTITITHNSQISDEVKQKITGALNTAGAQTEYTDDAVIITARYYPTPDIIRIYSSDSMLLYLDLVEIFFF